MEYIYSVGLMCSSIWMLYQNCFAAAVSCTFRWCKCSDLGDCGWLHMCSRDSQTFISDNNLASINGGTCLLPPYIYAYTLSASTTIPEPDCQNEKKLLFLSRTHTLTHMHTHTKRTLIIWMAIISYTRNNAYITLMCWLNKTKNFILCTHARIIQHHMRNTYGRTKQCIWTMRAHNGTHNTGYYAEHIADNKDIKDNVTVPVRSETRGINLHNLSYAGPIVMGFGGNFRFLFNWIYIASHLLHTIYVYAREVCEMKVKWWMWCGGWTHIVAHASYLRATNFHHNWNVCRVLTLNFVSKLMFLLKIWFIVFVGGFYVLIGMNRG